MAGQGDFPETFGQNFTPRRREETKPKFDIYKITSYNKHFNNFDLFTNTKDEKPIRMDSFYKLPEVSPDGSILKLDQKEREDYR